MVLSPQPRLGADGLAPPPSYSRISTPLKRSPTLLALPDHLLLAILAEVPLVSLSRDVRLVNRQLFLFASHLLRRALLPVYQSKVRPGYSTDAQGFRTLSPDISSGDVTRRSRELAVLDLFIASCVQEAVKAEESELYLLPSTSASLERDLFDLLQPQARLTDLFIAYGIEDGYVRPSPTPALGDPAQIVADEVVIQLSARSAKLLLPFPSASRKGQIVQKAFVDVPRREGERLEKVAADLVLAVSRVPLAREGGEKGWYIKGS